MQEFDMDAYIRQAAVDNSVRHIEALIATNIFVPPNTRSPLFESAIIDTLICLNDLLQRAAREGKRVTFDDEVTSAIGEPKDITTLINACRNAACHIQSKNINLDMGSVKFTVFVGYLPNALDINGVIFGCDYADDVAIQYGPMRVYLKRHVLLAFEEVKIRLGVNKAS